MNLPEAKKTLELLLENVGLLRAQLAGAQNMRLHDATNTAEAALDDIRMELRRGRTMTIDVYRNRVIELFKSGKASEEQWDEMASVVLRASEDDGAITELIDKDIMPLDEDDLFSGCTNPDCPVGCPPNHALTPEYLAMISAQDEEL